MKKALKKVIIWILVFSFFIEITPVWALTKEENIYTKLNSNGSVNNIFVYEHIYGTNDNLINDKSSLSNIENISGNEKYTIDNNSLTWEANGNDIYYTGSTSKDLPISMNIKYYLNDEEFEAKDILGKKGHIKIVIKYENHLKKQVIVNGKIETLYTPFVIATTSLLSNENNKNIKVSNGKAINNGITTIIVGLSSPGLYESLDLEELKSFDTIEITYDTKSFELSSMYAVATSKIIEDNDFNILNNIKKLYSAVDELQKNMDLLVDGSKQIANGTNQLNSAISNISNKYYQYRSIDKNEILDKITPLILSSVDELAPILKEKVTDEAQNVIKANKAEMAASISDMAINNTKDIIQGEIDRLVANINYEDLLNQIVGSNLTNLLMQDDNINKIANSFKTALEEELQKQIINTAIDAISNLDEEIDIGITNEEIEYLSNKYNINQNDAKNMAQEVQLMTFAKVANSAESISHSLANTIINNMTNKQYVEMIVTNYVTNVGEKIAAIFENNPNLEAYQQELIKNVAAYLKKELSKEELINKYLEANEYINNLVDKIIDDTSKDIADKYTVDMTKQIINNIINEELNNLEVKDELSKVLDKYENNINEKLTIIDDNVSKLTSGVSMLNDGATKLANGLEMYNEQGIKKISGLVNTNVKSLTGKIDALTKLSKDYKTLDDINEKDSGKSKIIFMVDALKKVEDKKITTEKIVEKETIWDKIKGLFK